MFLLGFLAWLTLAIRLVDRSRRTYESYVYGKSPRWFHALRGIQSDILHGYVAEDRQGGLFAWRWFRASADAVIRSLGDFFLHPVVFLSIMAAINLYFVLYRLVSLKDQLIPFIGSLPGSAYFWLIFYFVVSFNIALVFTYGIYARFTKPVCLPQVEIMDVPPTAIVYTVRGEGSGLFERMAYTLRGNALPNVHLWILSGDTTEPYLAYEASVVQRLRRYFGETRVRYFHTTDKTVKKAQIIESWLKGPGGHYKYFIICDADSLLPPHVALKFLRYAEHPDNAHIAIFQSSLRGIGHKTFYGAWQAGGIEKIMHTEVPVNHRIFGTMLYVGHNALVRVDDFKRISTPGRILSHDIWDSAFLDLRGKKIAFCHDVVSFEQTPANFLEDIKRIGRWSRGNFQTFPLLFRRGLSLGIRFQVFYGIYTYLMQPVFVVWIALGLGKTHQQIWRGMSGLSLEQLSGFFVVIFILFFNQLVEGADLSPKRIMKILWAFFVSTVISVNMILYNTLNILQMPFRKGSWVPMRKDPQTSLSVAETFLALWPGTLIGFSLLTVAQYYPYWFVMAFPLIFSLVFSVPVVYLTGKEWGHNNRQVRRV